MMLFAQVLVSPLKTQGPLEADIILRRDQRHGFSGRADIGIKLLFVLVIPTRQRWQLLSLTVTANPTEDWVARQITEAFPWNEAPKYLIRDRDGSDGNAITRRLAAMGNP